MEEQDFKKIEEMLQRHLGIISEDFQHKLDLVVKGQQMIAEKLDETRIELKEELRKVDNRLTLVEARLEKKIDGIAADLSAHRADTEAHDLKGYRVREE